MSTLARVGRHGIAIIAVLIAIVTFLLYIGLVFAKDGRDWGHDPATSQWFKSLRNSQGLSCCDTVDGVRLEAPEWKENPDGTYEVFARGEWHTVDKDRVLTATNRVGYAIL